MSALGTVETAETIVPLASDAPAWPVTWGASTFSADLGKPLGTTVYVGFELVRIYSTGQEEVVATLDDTAGGSDVVLVDPQGSTEVTYDVCTVNSAGATACGPVEWTELVACATPTPTGGGGSSGAPFGPGCKMCPKPQ